MVDYSITYPLTREAAEELREPLLSVVLDLIKSVQEMDEGYTLVFGREPQAVQPAAQLMQVERVMNPFMRMSLVVESNEGPVKLELSGPSGTKEFLYSEFGLKRWILS
ncbi:hypothetical protein [Ketobacter alkanivorans]|uniref:Uncharacterized protein n=1 Tax=Ketobacter alkanivorans TaxID=1917421 RepID=A0A2K9LG36_9GAMM|nr:hypothetical protein [Ketobacter alkanivorans]AUM11242.1 hypothetical protein Kalk_01825 [Ketobacter alkanivorans]MCP5015922.1 hypothetical protein [Ketobacter sp.]